MKNQLNLLVTIAWQMYQCVNSPFNQIEMELNYSYNLGKALGPLKMEGVLKMGS